MSELQTARRASMGSILLKGLLFIGLAVPGALLAVFSGIILGGSLSTPAEMLPDLRVVTVCYFVGALLTLIGLGKLRQWLYGLVFLTMPLAFWLYALVDRNMATGLFPFLTFVGGAGFLTYRLVDRHYKRTDV